MTKTKEQVLEELVKKEEERVANAGEGEEVQPKEFDIDLIQP